MDTINEMKNIPTSVGKTQFVLRKVQANREVVYCFKHGTSDLVYNEVQDMLDTWSFDCQEVLGYEQYTNDETLVSGLASVLEKLDAAIQYIVTDFKWQTDLKRHLKKTQSARKTPRMCPSVGTVYPCHYGQCRLTHD